MLKWYFLGQGWAFQGGREEDEEALSCFAQIPGGTSGTCLCFAGWEIQIFQAVHGSFQPRFICISCRVWGRHSPRHRQSHRQGCSRHFPHRTEYWRRNGFQPRPWLLGEANTGAHKWSWPSEDSKTHDRLFAHQMKKSDPNTMLHPCQQKIWDLISLWRGDLLIPVVICLLLSLDKIHLLGLQLLYIHLCWQHYSLSSAVSPTRCPEAKPVILPGPSVSAQPPVRVQAPITRWFSCIHPSKSLLERLSVVSRAEAVNTSVTTQLKAAAGPFCPK